MTKNELLEMAREVGLLFNEESGTEAAHAIHHERLQSFCNAILERAAVECDWVPSMDRKNEECAKAVRAMKIDN